MLRFLLSLLLNWIEQPKINVVAPTEIIPLPGILKPESDLDTKMIDHLPVYKTKGSAGFDIMAYEEEGISKRLLVEPGKVAIIPTGLFVQIPVGYELQIRPRSGLATKGIIVVNSPGTIDSDYRGEIKIILGNLGPETFYIESGDRIAQGVIARVPKARLVRVSVISDKTERGAGGFGSTGVK